MDAVLVRGARNVSTFQMDDIKEAAQITAFRNYLGMLADENAQLAAQFADASQLGLRVIT